MGSIKSVAPEEDMSCTRPGTADLYSALTGTTYRLFFIVIIGSCKYFEYAGDVITLFSA